MGPENGMNSSEVYYFDMEEYIKRIKLESYLLEHLEETNANFEEYLKYLTKYDNYSVIYYFIDLLSKELKYSQAIENHHYIPPKELLDSDVFFDTFQMSHNRIKDLHQFVTNREVPYGYRNSEVRVSRMTDHGEEIFWRGAQSIDVKKFMDDFIRIYKMNSLSLLSSNPFLKSALMHLLFVRIHPFTDGNGRCARMIHNIKFTEGINKIYGMKLKICPLNLSHSILVNQLTYVNRIDHIYFDLEHDSNDEINKWFDFVLNMVDEQLYFSMNRISNLDRAFANLSQMKEFDTSEMQDKIKKMVIKAN